MTQVRKRRKVLVSGLSTPPPPDTWQGLFSVNPPWGSTFHAPNTAQYGKRIATGSLTPATSIPTNSLGTDNGTTVNLTVAGSTVSGYDFRNRRVTIGANNITIVDCLFDEQKKVVGNAFSLQKAAGRTGLTVDHCTFAGNKDTTDFRNAFIDARDGAIVVQYCDAYDMNEDFCQFMEGTMYRNYVHNYGYGTNNHGDAFQIYKQTGPCTIQENFIDNRYPADGTANLDTSGIRVIGEQSNINAVQIIGNVVWGDPSWYSVGLSAQDPYAAVNCLMKDNWMWNTNNSTHIYPITTTGIRIGTTYTNNRNLSTGAAIVGTEDTYSVDVQPVLNKTKDGSQGQTYSVTPATTTNLPVPTYQWYRRNTITGALTIQAGQTSTSYVTGAGDLSSGLRCVVDYIILQINLDTVGWILPTTQPIWNVNDTTGTTNNASGTVIYANDSTNKIDGYGSIQATLTGVSNGTYLQKTSLLTSQIPADIDVITVAVLLDSTPNFQTVSTIDPRPGVGGTYYTGGSRATTVHLNTGKFIHSFPVSAIATFKDLGASTIDFRLIMSSSGGSASPYCAQPRESIVVGKSGGIPTAVLTFDDGRFSIHDWILPQLASRGLTAHFNCPTSNMTGATFMPMSYVKDLFDAGWSIGIDGTPDDIPITSYANMAAVVSGITTMWNALAANGMDSDGKYHGCWPNGTTRASESLVTVASVTSNGTTSITMASTAGIGTGTNWQVAGYQVPVGTYVVSITNSTTLVLSNTIPSQTKPMTFTDTTSEYYTCKAFDAFRTAGVRTMRQTNGGELTTRFGVGGRDMLLNGNSMSNSGGDNTAALMNARVETAKTNKTTTISYAHNAVDTIVSGLDTLKTELSSHYDYLAAEVQAQRIQVLNMTQLWARDGTSSFP